MIKLTNTLTGQKEEFIPRTEKNVGMFVCGPTIYDYSHIGHARTYIFFDVVARYLKYRGYKLKYLMNITDIDDKVIDRAKRDGISVKDLVKKFEKSFYEDIKSLKIESVNKFARATDYIKQIIKQVQILVAKGNAYKIDGDGYYFNLSTFPDYGKLAHRTVEQAEDAISRIDESVNKRNKGDFALWKLAPHQARPRFWWSADKLGAGFSEPFWNSPLGAGRPGWHIEDTAITDYHFGPQYDLHGGAVDLVFPHHEAEIAQQESASGKKPFVKYWLHSGFLTVNGRKMSKSLGNFITVKYILKKYSPEFIRMMALSVYYRSPLDFNESVITQSQAGIKRIYEFYQKLNLSSGTGRKNIEKKIKETRQKFIDSMDDDFNTPQALAVLFDFIRDLNTDLTGNSLDKNSLKSTKKFLREADNILGIVPTKQEKIPDEIIKLVEKRDKLREEKNWQEADNIRAQINNLGYKVEDTIYGPLTDKK